jgi:putative addiction module component (TIGR02574 family)
MSDVRARIEGLSVEEKFELLDALWESIEADAPYITAEQRSELDRRIAHYEEHPADVTPWEQVRADLFRQP